MNGARSSSTASQDDRYLVANQVVLDRELVAGVHAKRSAAALEARRGPGGRALGVGCERWAGFDPSKGRPSGQVVGTDIDESMLDTARSFLQDAELANVERVSTLFDGELEPQSFDSSRTLLIAPLGRGSEQVA